MRFYPTHGRIVREYNPCHNPAGSGKGGGRFCAAGIPGRSEALIAKARDRVDATEMGWSGRWRLAEHEAAYRRLSDEDKTAIDGALRAALSDAQVATRVPGEVLESILVEGRIKNQFETGTSRGTSPRTRLTTSRTFDAGSSSRPWASRMSSPGRTGRFTGILYRQGWRDSGQLIRGRGAGDETGGAKATTGVVGDSFGAMHEPMHGGKETLPNQYMMAEPLEEPTWRMLHPRHRRDIADYYEGGLPSEKAKTEFAKIALKTLGESYIEAQIHGGVKLDDVEEIRVQRRYDLSETVALLKRHGWEPTVEMAFGKIADEEEGKVAEAGNMIRFRRVS